MDPAGKKLPEKITKKILLLRALINHPRLIMLEEPFDGIEEKVKNKIIDYLLTDTPHQTVLVISNDPVFAAKCDSVIYMEEGAIKAVGNWKTIQHLIKN